MKKIITLALALLISSCDSKATDNKTYYIQSQDITTRDDGTVVWVTTYIVIDADGNATRDVDIVEVK